MMETELKIIKRFIENNKPATIRDIARQIDADYKITHIAVQRLIGKKILYVQAVGKSSLCSSNESYYGMEIYEAEYGRMQAALKNSSISQLYKEIVSKIKTGFFVLLLFGSYAKGKQKKTSDIDIMFISNESGFEDKVSGIISLIPLKIHALTFTEEEFVRMKNARKPNVVQEAVENNTILYGIEAYYLMKNA